MGRESMTAQVPTWAQFTSFETYIFDCDGVIWNIRAEDTRSSVETINFLLGMGKRVMFVTNNSNKRRSDFLHELVAKGIDFRDRSDEEKLDMMISASYTTAKYLSENGLRHPFVITTDTGLLQELRAVGITEYFATVDEAGNTLPMFESALQKGSEPEIVDIIKGRPEVDCIVMGWDMGLTAKKIVTAINYIKFNEDLHKHEPGYKEIPIIACSGDASGVFGTVEYERQPVKFRAVGNGAMAEFLASCFDPRRAYLDMGKPSDALLQLLANPHAYHVDLSKALMVGDTIQTDIVFGNRGKMQSLLVLTGVTTQRELEEAIEAGDPERIPTYVLAKLGSWAERGPLPPSDAPV